MAHLIKLKSVYYAQRKIPEKPKGLRAAVAKLLKNKRPELVHLKRSLGTENITEAKIRVKPVATRRAFRRFEQTLRRRSSPPHPPLHHRHVW
jgi:hypothetical protein